MSVYFVRVGRYFKIGYTENPQRRFMALHKSGTRYTFPVDASWDIEDRQLYKVIDGWMNVEQAVHLALDDFAVGLEWFLDEPPVRDFIDALPDFEPYGDCPEFPRVEREGGWCQAEYNEVQAGRAEREVQRYMARRAS